jgi:hypothetical protein
MCYFASMDGTHLGGQYGSNGDRLSVERYKLHFERFAAFMDMDDCSNISCFQTFFRDLAF